jgi:hypothetical protein
MQPHAPLLRILYGKAIHACTVPQADLGGRAAAFRSDIVHDQGLDDHA